MGVWVHGCRHLCRHQMVCLTCVYPTRCQCWLNRKARPANPFRTLVNGRRKVLVQLTLKHTPNTTTDG